MIDRVISRPIRVLVSYEKEKEFTLTTREGTECLLQRIIDRNYTNMATVTHTLAVFLVLFTVHNVRTSTTKTFAFPEYQYKETSKNEMLFRKYEQMCEEKACKGAPQQSSSVAKTRCIRQCVSPSCYREIYLFDQLEEGEIDVRLNSFKGCFMQRNGRPKN